MRFVICGFVLVAGVVQAQSVFVEDSLQRVGPTDAPGTATSIALYAAKGESESFQAIVHAAGTSFTVTGVTASNLIGPSGAVISQQDYTFYREHYVSVGQSGPSLGGTNQSMGAGTYPDALIPFKNPSTGQVLTGGTYEAVPFTVAANNNQPYWIDINVPRTAVAGTYTGTVTVTTTGGTWTIPVSLQVWNFSLPVAPAEKATFAYHGTNGTVANNTLLLEHRIGPFIVPTSQLSTAKSYGASITGLEYFNQSRGCTIETPPSETTVAATVAQYGGFPTYVYPADEVNGCANLAQNLQKWAQVAHEAGTKTLITVIPASDLLDDGLGTGQTDVDIWSILPKQYAAALPLIPTVKAKGNEVWSYTALVQENYSPKWQIDFAPINFRIFPGFVNQQFGFTGMLYSDIDRWTSSPWTNVDTFQIVTSTATYHYYGEGMLVYPGTYVGMASPAVVPSMRLKFLRDGWDDYDYIEMLKSQGDSAFVDPIVNSIAPDWTNWTRSTSTLLNARIQMGNELDRLAGGGSQVVATPSISPNGGTYTSAQTVSISSSTSGSSIRYTTDGSTPSSMVGTLYSTPITVSSNQTINAIAYISGWTNSAVNSATFTINSVVATPSISPNGGTYTSAQTVSIRSSTSGSSIRYTTDGSTPSSTAGTLYSTPITVSSSQTIKATAYMSGWTNSAVSSANFTINSLQAPTNPSPATGSTGVGTAVTLQASAVTGATQYQVYLGTSSSALSLVGNGTASGSVVQLAVSGLSAGTTYYWKIVASNGSSSASSSIWSFTTDAPVSLQAPSNPWPQSGTTAATSLTLQCNAVTGATQYQFYLGTSSSALSLLGTPTASAGVVRQAVFQLAANTTYYWNVVASNGTASVTSPVWSFSTNAPVTLQAPSNPWPTTGTIGTATSLTLQVNAVSGATQYQYYLGTNSSNLTLVGTEAASGAVVRYPALRLASGTTWYWKVVATNGSTSASSPIWSFKTN